MTMGVYGIKNKVNGKLYIGSSINIEQRWMSHKYNLNKGSHHSSHLQKSWNRYGSENFLFYVIEEVDSVEILKDVEQREINVCQSHLREFGYNIRNIVDRALAVTNGLIVKKPKPIKAIDFEPKIIINFKVTPDDREHLRILAAKARLSQSEFLRKLIYNYGNNLVECERSQAMTEQ